MIRKVMTRPDNTTKEIDYAASAESLFYPAKQKRTLAVYKNAAGKKTKCVETTTDEDGNKTTTTSKATDATTNKTTDNAMTDKAIGNNDKFTVTTTETAAGGTLVVHKNASGRETKRVETKKDSTKHLVIPASMTSIGREAFKNNGLTSVSIPASVKSVGSDAFKDNNTLNKVTITGRGAIRDNAFTYKVSRWNAKGIFAESSSSRIALVIEDGITSIGKQAFEKNKLTSVRIPSSVTSIGENAFDSNELKKVIIPLSVTSIGQGAFQYNQLTSVSILSSMTHLSGFSNNQKRRHKTFGDCKRRDYDWG